MGLFGGRGSSVIEWEETDSETIFWKWPDTEIRKGSRLMIRAGQDAIFMKDGRLEGIFEDEGTYDIESDIVPLLNTLRGFRFGFNGSLRAEVLFVNTKLFTVKWGTRGAVTLRSRSLPGGLPIRAFGTFQCKVCDVVPLIDEIAGVRRQYQVADIKELVVSELDPLLMKWMSEEGQDIFHLQEHSEGISRGICEDLDMKLRRIGIAITDFHIQNVSYPEDVQELARRAIAQSFQAKGSADAAGNSGARPNFCPNCGTPSGTANFCPNCGHRLV